MANYIDRCLDEGVRPCEEYCTTVLKAAETGYRGDLCVSECDPVLCVHEAGHAVAAHVLGRPITSVSVRVGAAREAVHVGADDTRYYRVLSLNGTLWFDGPGGRTRYADEPEVEGAEYAARLYRDTVITAAGPLAQHVYTGEPVKAILADADPSGITDWRLIESDWICTYADLMFPEPPFEMPEGEWSVEDMQRFSDWQGEQTAGVMPQMWSDAERVVRENWNMVSGLAAVLTVNPYLRGREIRRILGRVKARRAA